METTMNPEQMVLSEQIHLLIDQLGGKDNIDSVLPCATRLRIKLQKQPAANVEKLKQQIPSIKYFVHSSSCPVYEDFASFYLHFFIITRNQPSFQV